MPNDDSIFPVMIDRKVGRLSYAASILFGRNFEVTSLYYDEDDEQVLATGSFLLTISRRALILTKDRKPFIVRSWSRVDSSSYYNEKRALPYMLSGVKVGDVFKDASDYWEQVEDDDSKYLVFKKKSRVAITIAYR